MTYQIHQFYCNRCRQATPHETSEDEQKARCITCAEKQGRIEFEKQKFSDTNRHIAALDGMGNRGPR
jgi:hypothetical protein